MAQLPSASSGQLNYSDLEAVPAERSPQASPQYYDCYPYPIYAGEDEHNLDHTQLQQNERYASSSIFQLPKETPWLTPHEAHYAPPLKDTAQTAHSVEPLLEPKSNRKRWIWITVAAVVAVAAIAGGVTGGILFTRPKKESQPIVDSESG
jgi:hypothetical protein